MEFDFNFLFKYNDWITFVHIAGAIMAVGAVTVSDIIFTWVKFRPKMAPLAARIMHLFSLQIWIGLLLISASGLLLFLPMRGLEEVPIFQFKMLLVLAVFLNGIFLNVWVNPKFKELAPEWHLKTKKVRSFTKIAGISAAVSFLGWWGIILLMTVFY